MNALAALDFCLQFSAAQTRLRRKLDEELGALHGLSLQDFVLLRGLSAAPGQQCSAVRLEAALGIPASAIVRQVLALEKTGWVEREADASGQRVITLRASGRRVLMEAAETAAGICSAALRACSPARIDGAAEVLSELLASAALELR